MAAQRVRIRVEGIVQGVGFRPFVLALATRFRLGGHVSNDSEGVAIEVEGDAERLREFLAALEREAPPLALIERISTVAIDSRGTHAFTITTSERGPERATLISPDVATCDDCLRELWDPADRRFGFPFINCTNCGPRFTIVRDVPYDRATTTMASFAMCADCAREYADPADRRFHAQPVACPACGPHLVLVDAQRHSLAADAIAGSVATIRSGGIVAIKGLGGYHLATDAAHETAVATLRARKHREEKPFALMAPSLETAGALAELDGEEARLLTSPRRPIVLVRRRPSARVAPSVAPGNRFLGIMLPYAPVHHLLLRNLGASIVLTSGNVSDEPIAYRDDEVFDRLATIADAFLTHDRAIHVRTDDSVVRAFRGVPLPIRRSRGWAPQPIPVAIEFRRPVLACGAELKNTFCLGKGRHAFVSHHIGDLENADALRSFTEGLAHWQRMFDVRPEVIAHDLHPEYLSTKWALAQHGVQRVGVQHHHAHIASCLADSGEVGPVIGVAFDGLGYGSDGTLWGGEILIADLHGFRRLAHLSNVPMPGGVAAIRAPWRMAAAYLAPLFGRALPPLAVAQRHADQWRAVVDLTRSRAHAPLTSSAGRLFDAVAALLGVRDEISYEGQAAIELEQLVDSGEPGSYRASLDERGESVEICAGDLVRAVVDDLSRGVPSPAIAARFHHGVADAILAACRIARDRSGLDVVALSGGVFQNVVLLERAVDRLEADRFRILRHRQVPPNDGGISLGQAVIAARATE